MLHSSLGHMVTSLWFLVDPEIKQKIDASIASNKQEISMCDNERKDFDKEMNILIEEDKEFLKRHVCPRFLLISGRHYMLNDHLFRRASRCARMPFSRRRSVRQNWNPNLVRHPVIFSRYES